MNKTHKKLYIEIAISAVTLAVVAWFFSWGWDYLDAVEDTNARTVQHENLRAEAAAGDPQAQRDLGMYLLFDDDSGKASVTEAMQLFESAYDKGVAPPAGLECAIAEVYLEGEGDLPPDLQKAVTWFRIGVANGQADCITRLATIYLQGGHGVAADPAQAFKLFQQTGNHYEMAKLYLAGSGVTQNKQEAYDEFLAAIKRFWPADRMAEMELQVARLADEGLGDDAGDETTLYWLLRASCDAAGNEGEPFEGADLLADVQSRLTQEQIAAVKERVKSFIPASTALLPPVPEGASQNYYASCPAVE